MKVDLPDDKYVVAVSGGVDSVMLLDLLSHEPKLELIVAHFDHGIRPDSAKDRRFVERLAKKYGLPFVYGEGKLGAKASEAVARKARYDFLRKVQKERHAEAIITAHHQDDMLETAILNLLRGTHRRGLSSLRSTKDIKRPLLDFPKAELITYAKTHHLDWREDSTNSDEIYLRNYIRRQILPKFSSTDRHRFLEILGSAKYTNEAADGIVARMLKTQSAYTLDRLWFEQLPHAVAKDIMIAWLNQAGVQGIDRKLLETLVIAAKTLSAGKQRDINTIYILEIKEKTLALVTRDR